MAAQASHYYTAQEARELLGMTHSALLNQVTAGNLQRIIPPGKRQGVYLKEEVDQLKRELDSFFTHRQALQKAPTTFVRATPEDMPEAVALADLVFGELNTIPVERRVAWLRTNPDIDYLLKQEGQLVGYVSLVPLRPETIEDLLSQRRYAKELTADDILPFEPGVPVDLYGMAIGVRSGVSLRQKREWGAALLSGVRHLLLELGQRGVILRTIQAHSTKPDGIRLMRHFGFTEMEPKVPGFHDFFIDVDVSGIPFLVEYKEALRAWQEQLGGTATTGADRRAGAQGRVGERRRRKDTAASV
jgi:hypothetical protein